MASCVKKTTKILSITKALISRSIFLFHGLISIWRVTQIKRNLVYWFLSGTLPLMVVETFYTLCKKKDREWKWICPSVVLYLATSVPAIWFLELDLMRQRIMLGRQPPVNNTHNNVIMLNGKMIRIAISLGSEEWCKILEQLLLLILIIGRWLLPKGEITREQLSQLLLVYIGMAADIIELFEAFKEQTVRENTLLTIVILSLWTASLTQFTLVITATKAKKTRVATVDRSNKRNTCCPTEVVSILISVFLQDAPFLVLRMLLIFRYDVLSYTNIFFTCKNTLVLVLQFYRLIVLFTLTSSEDTAQHRTPVKPRSFSSSDTLHDAYASSESSEESSSSGNRSPVERRTRKLSQRRREMMRHCKEDTTKIVSSSNDMSETKHSLKNEIGKSKSRTRERLSKASLIFKATRRGSNSSNDRSPNRNKRKPTEKKSTHVHSRDAERGLVVEGQRDGKIRKKDNFRQGEVQKKIQRFEKSEPAIDTDTSDHVISEDSPVTSNRKHKSKGIPKNDIKESYNDRSRQEWSGKDYHRTLRKDGRSENQHQNTHHQKNWEPVKDMRSTMAFLNETGKYKTVTVKSDDDGKMMYVIRA